MHQGRSRTDPQMCHTVSTLVPADSIVYFLHQILCKPALPGDITGDPGTVVDLVHIQIHAGIYL